MSLPAREECLSFYRELGTPDNIISHVLVVNRIAVFLAKRLRREGLPVDVELVDRASLLHDLDKWPCIQNKNIEHGFETERILAEKGYPEAGYYARQHRADLIINGLETWEEKIINYADRRVVEDRIVGMAERWDYINHKYPSKDGEKRRLMVKLSSELEKEIFSRIKMRPEELEREMDSEH